MTLLSISILEKKNYNSHSYKQLRWRELSFQVCNFATLVVKTTHLKNKLKFKNHSSSNNTERHLANINADTWVCAEHKCRKCNKHITEAYITPQIAYIHYGSHGNYMYSYKQLWMDSITSQANNLLSSYSVLMAIIKQTWVNWFRLSFLHPLCFGKNNKCANETAT